MNSFMETVRQEWTVWLGPMISFFAVFAIGWLVRRYAFRRLEAWASQSKGLMDNLLVKAIKGPFILWVVILALHLATVAANLPAHIEAVTEKTFLILWIVSLTLVAARLAGSLVKHFGRSVASALPVTTLTQSLARLAVATAGALILLDTLHISVTPILTALGVGGLAVALALQDTLSNLFAGFYVSIAGQVRVGHYIKLETGEEGYVVDISWRATTLRALPNNLIVVPNAKLAQIIVTNYSLPEPRMSLLIPVSVSYDSDINKVEHILLETAKTGATEIRGMLSEPAPMVRFIPGFGASSLDFTLICQVAEFVDQFVVQHELRKRIFRRFREEGIEIPFPTRTVYMKTNPSL